MPGIEVWMVVPEKEIELAEMIIDHMPKRVRRKFKLIPADQSMNVWAQDASKPLADGETTLAQPKGNEVIRDENLVPLRSMQESGLIDVIPSPFAFEGGNIIVGNRHIFVGPDIVRDLSKQFHISRKNAVSVLSEHWNKEVIEIGRPNADGVLEQVDFHIDLSMAIAKAKLGRWEKREEVAIVSSPFMLLEEILGFPPIKNMDRDTYYDKMRELAYKVGYEDFPFKLTHTDKRLLLEMSELSYDDILVEELGYESMVETLVENGYKVVRIPGHNRFDEEQTLRAFNFTNVIFSGKNAIIPRYDSNLLDPYIREYYRKLGFNVVGIRAVQNFICKKGGIRCLSETYRRPVFIKK